MAERSYGTMVVAGIIRNNGRILIAQRKKDGRHPLKWEFPGGKVEPGETPSEALKRELAEELEIDAEIGPEIVRYEHSYSREKAILLIFLEVVDYTGEPANMVFEQMCWETGENLASYDFLDGDIDFIRRLNRGEFHQTLL